LSQPSDRPQPSDRKKQSSRKKMLSTKEKLDQLEEEKKARARSVKRAPAEPLLEVDLGSIEPIDHLVAPVNETIVRLREQLSTLQEQHMELGNTHGQDESALAPAPSEGPPLSNRQVMLRQKAVELWRGTIAEELAKLGSSLQGALMSDEKLRQIFDHIDTDKGGSIDKDELKHALDGAGKKLGDETIDAMLNAADEDANGEISFEEFSAILKGVKATKAASTIGRKFRENRDGQKRKKTTKKSVAELKNTTTLARRALDRSLGAALLARKSNPKDLVQRWDRKQKGAINRMEFRQGVRDDLGLSFENKDLDEWFDRFDVDAGGTIDEAELKSALKLLQDKATEDERLREELSSQLKSVADKISRLEDMSSAMIGAQQAALDSATKLSEHRALPAIDAKIGEKLNAKLKSDLNEKGMELEDLHASWNVAKKVPGWMDKAEFMKAATATLTEVTLKRQKAEASKAAPSRTAEERDKMQQMSTDERETYQAREALKAVSINEEDVSVLFDTILAHAMALDDDSKPRDEQHAVLLEIEPTLKLMMAADPARKSTDASLFQVASRLRDAALEQQAITKQGMAEFEAAEKAEASAVRLKAEEKAKAAEEVKKEAAAAKRSAAVTKKDAKVPAWMKPAEGEQSAAGTEESPPASRTPTAATEGSVDVATDANDAFLSKLSNVDGNVYNSSPLAAAPAPALQ